MAQQSSRLCERACAAIVAVSVSGAALLGGCESSGLLRLQLGTAVDTLNYRIYDDNTCQGAPFTDSETPLRELTWSDPHPATSLIEMKVGPPWQGKGVRLEVTTTSAGGSGFWCACVRLPRAGVAGWPLEVAPVGTQPSACTFVLDISGNGGNTPPSHAGVLLESEGAVPYPLVVRPGMSLTAKCEAADIDPGQTAELVYSWTVTEGCPAPRLAIGKEVTITVPPAEREHALSCTVECTVTDPTGLSTSKTSAFEVTDNQPPVGCVIVEPTAVLEGKELTVTCVATDPDGPRPAFEAWAQPPGWTQKAESDIHPCSRCQFGNAWCRDLTLTAPNGPLAGQREKVEFGCRVNDGDYFGKVDLAPAAVELVGSTPPEITAFRILKDNTPQSAEDLNLVMEGERLTVQCDATDVDTNNGDVVEVSISVSGLQILSGTPISTTGRASVTLGVGGMAGQSEEFAIDCHATDVAGLRAYAPQTWWVTYSRNEPPVVTVKADSSYLLGGATTDVYCHVENEPTNHHPLTFKWTCSPSPCTVTPVDAESARFLAPTPSGAGSAYPYNVVCEAKDRFGQSASDEAVVNVSTTPDFRQVLVAYYGYSQFDPAPVKDLLRFYTLSQEDPCALGAWYPPENDIRSGDQTHILDQDTTAYLYLYVVASPITAAGRAVVVAQGEATAKAFVIDGLRPGDILANGPPPHFEIVLTDLPNAAAGAGVRYRTVAVNAFDDGSIIVAASGLESNKAVLRAWRIPPDHGQESGPIAPLTTPNDESAERLRWLRMATTRATDGRLLAAAVGIANYGGASLRARAALWTWDGVGAATFDLLPSLTDSLQFLSADFPVVDVVFGSNSEPIFVYPTTAAGKLMLAWAARQAGSWAYTSRVASALDVAYFETIIATKSGAEVGFLGRTRFPSGGPAYNALVAARPEAAGTDVQVLSDTAYPCDLANDTIVANIAAVPVRDLPASPAGSPWFLLWNREFGTPPSFNYGFSDLTGALQPAACGQGCLSTGVLLAGKAVLNFDVARLGNRAVGLVSYASAGPTYGAVFMRTSPGMASEAAGSTISPDTCDDGRFALKSSAAPDRQAPFALAVH